jgi:hypothetical protein
MSFDDVPVAVETNLPAAHRDAITTYTKYFANVESFLLFLSLSLADSLIAIQESYFGYIFHWNAAQGPMNASVHIPRGKQKIYQVFLS